jgi:hypothetical protein
MPTRRKRPGETEAEQQQAGGFGHGYQRAGRHMVVRRQVGGREGRRVAAGGVAGR